MLHYKDNLKIPIFTKTPLKYSDNYTFIPLQWKQNQDIIIQTPKLYTPYGVQQNQNSKDYIMVSFQNKTNDIFTQKFLDDLDWIYEQIKEHYLGLKQVNSFIKSYKNESVMNIKLKEDSYIYNHQKIKCDDIPLYSYASYIIHLPGLWVSENQVWIPWYILQTRLENNCKLSSYAFKESVPPPPPPPPPPPRIKDKYSKMIHMGIPSEAVKKQRQIDLKSGINPGMLQSVQLKSVTNQKDMKTNMKSDMNGFEPPSLDSLQMALRKLRTVITMGQT